MINHSLRTYKCSFSYFFCYILQNKQSHRHVLCSVMSHVVLLHIEYRYERFRRKIRAKQNDFVFNVARKSHCARHATENGRTFYEDDDVDDDPVVIGNHSNKKTSCTKVNWKTTAGESRDLNTLVEVQLSKVSPSLIHVSKIQF